MIIYSDIKYTYPYFMKVSRGILDMIAANPAMNIDNAKQMALNYNTATIKYKIETTFPPSIFLIPKHPLVERSNVSCIPSPCDNTFHDTIKYNGIMMHRSLVKYNGTLKVHGTVTFTKDGIIITGTYADDKLNGLATSEDPATSTEIQENYINGKATSREIYVNGVLRTRYRLVNYMPDGDGMIDGTNVTFNRGVQIIPPS
jgi:hypothetical protein